MALLLEIARCQVAKDVREGKLVGSSCQGIVGVQKDRRLPFHLPEPWSGHLETARLLFISSNPSIDYNEHYPNEKWSDEEITDFFHNRFTADEPWINGKNQTLQVFGDRGRSVPFLRGVKRLARDIIQDAQPGIDYALTEVVHCKSRNEKTGVAEAVTQCAGYMDKIIALAGASVLIVLGDHAKGVMRQRRDKIPSDKLMVFFPHPRRWDFDRDAYPSEDDLQPLRDRLASEASASA